LRSAAERIRRLVRLTPRERRVLARAWCYLLALDVGLRILPVTRLLPCAPARRPRAMAVPPERVTHLLGLAWRLSPVRATCLKDALVLARLLRDEGVAATVRFGVARRDASLDAHAWVEHPGQAPGEPCHAGAYTPLTARR